MSPQQIHRVMQQAVAQHQAGKLAEAEQTYRRVLRDDPRNADALNLLGLIAHGGKHHERAAELIGKAITIRPQAEFYVNLSQAYRELGKRQETLDACRRAVQLNPKIPEAWNNLGSALKDMNQPQEALAAFERALQLRPEYALAYNNIGNTLSQLDRPAEAETAFGRAIELNPNYAEAYSNFGYMLGRQGRLDEAVRLCRRAMELLPSFAAVYVNLGTALHEQGKLEEGNEIYRRGLGVDPNNSKLAENLLGAFTQTTRWPPEHVLQAHVEWGRRFATPSAPIAPHTNSRSADRKLRIGYVSPDFRRHSVAYFFEPILEQHDRARFEITLYANIDHPDDVTDRLRKQCDRWRDVTSLSDEQLAQTIRQDGIDVLVDLAGHTAGNRLVAMGQKPAPVQMTYLGYPATTGVSAIDFRLTDEISDPVGMTDSHYSEKLIRLPAPFLCYRPPENSPEVVDPPALRNGFVTFGSFNRAPKVGPETIPLWAKVFGAVPSSRLLLKSKGLGDEGSRRRILDGFAGCGIGPERIQLVEADLSLAEHLAMYGQMDIALDTFPYHGTTTTCEAMWMGVPVLSLAGRTHGSRVGVSLLRAVGMEGLSTESGDSYVKMGQDFASDLNRLSAMRRTSRQRMAESPLCDPKRLTQALESAYMQAFSNWCIIGT